MEKYTQLCLPGFGLENDQEFMQAVIEEARLEIDRRNERDRLFLVEQHERLLKQYEQLRQTHNLPPWKKMQRIQAIPLAEFRSNVLPDKYLEISVTEVLSYLITRNTPVKLSSLAKRFNVSETKLKHALELCARYGAVHATHMVEQVEGYSVSWPEMGP